MVLIQALDTAVGEIYDALKRTGLYQNSGNKYFLSN